MSLLGPRQSGKTTLARTLLSPDSENYFDLERPTGLRRLEDPETSLSELRGLIVIDEVQRRPELFQILRVLIDRPRAPARFLLLGSASPALLRQSSESLAGRIEVIEMTGFSVEEVGQDHSARLWSRGGFPRSYVATSESRSFTWREEFIRTFLEQDLPQLGMRIPSPQLHRFWTMLAHYHGQVWNAAEPARSLGLSQPTVRSYLDLMTSAYMIRQLQPWHENLSKRQVKAPKIYVRDSGLLHALLGLRSRRDLLTHPKLGASWEGFVIEQLLHAAEPDQAYFWATHQGAEIDLLMLRGSRRVGVEIKRSDAPSLTPSMRIALDDLRLNKLWVIYPGRERYDLHKRVTAIPFDEAIAMKRTELL
ncbi:MAG TPA: ATP-binding protein [Steroidobacteraceae bacterium]|nr:ATP-binding protein [Steroidobacteraceae bacterium]